MTEINNSIAKRNDNEIQHFETESFCEIPVLPCCIAAGCSPEKKYENIILNCICSRIKRSETEDPKSANSTFNVAFCKKIKHR